jgi:hypothetical protein
LLASWRSRTKIAGSGSGSIGHGPQYWLRIPILIRPTTSSYIIYILKYSVGGIWNDASQIMNDTPRPHRRSFREGCRGVV